MLLQKCIWFKSYNFMTFIHQQYNLLLTQSICCSNTNSITSWFTAVYMCSCFSSCMCLPMCTVCSCLCVCVCQCALVCSCMCVYVCSCCLQLEIVSLVFCHPVSVCACVCVGQTDIDSVVNPVRKPACMFAHTNIPDSNWCIIVFRQWTALLIMCNSNGQPCQ